MISIVVYGRNDNYGYNIQKRAAISLNTFGELLSDSNDEVIFVDCNTDDEMPTFPEFISDTLSEKLKKHLRILRIHPHQYNRCRASVKRNVIESICRNVGIRRSNPRNRWVLNTNTDMVFVPVRQSSLTEVCADLKDGFYGLPRFEVPEVLWETLDRNRPADNIEKFRIWGQRLHLNEATTGSRWIRFDAPGDFQLALRHQLISISGMNEQMLLPWHVDSNLCRRMYLLCGEIKSLLGSLHAYHCDHTRVAAASMHIHGESQANDLQKYFHNVTKPEIDEQRETWGMADEEIEEIRLTGGHVKSLEQELLCLLPGMSNMCLTSVINEYSFNSGLLYNSEHVLPYVANHIAAIPGSWVVGYCGANEALLQMIISLRNRLGHTGKVLIDGEFERFRNRASGLKAVQNYEVADVHTLLKESDCICLDAWMGWGKQFKTRLGIKVPASGLEAQEFCSLLVKRCVTFSAEDSKTLSGPGCLGRGRKYLFLGTQHTWLEEVTTRLFRVALTPYSTYVRHGTVKKVNSNASRSE